jgi:hypothetical protein
MGKMFFFSAGDGDFVVTVEAKKSEEETKKFPSAHSSFPPHSFKHSRSCFPLDKAFKHEGPAPGGMKDAARRSSDFPSFVMKKKGAFARRLRKNTASETTAPLAGSRLAATPRARVLLLQ